MISRKSPLSIEALLCYPTMDFLFDLSKSPELLSFAEYDSIYGSPSPVDGIFTVSPSEIFPLTVTSSLDSSGYFAQAPLRLTPSRRASYPISKSDHDAAMQNENRLFREQFGVVPAYSLEISGVSCRKRPRAILPDVEDNFTPATNPAPSVLRMYAPRAPNAFILYRRANYSRMAKEFPDMATQEISKRLGELWRHESDGVKHQFREMARYIKGWNEERYKHLPKRRKRADLC